MNSRNRLLAVLIGAGLTAAAFVPAAQAYPLLTVTTAAPDNSGMVQDVQYRRRHYHHAPRHYRHHRRNDGAAIIGGLAAGAIIGGIIASQNQAPAGPRYYNNAGSAHVDWCFNRYRSYDVRSNTYQPYGGPRRQCVSPYY